MKLMNNRNIIGIQCLTLDPNLITSIVPVFIHMCIYAIKLLGGQ